MLGGILGACGNGEATAIAAPEVITEVFPGTEVAPITRAWVGGGWLIIFVLFIIFRLCCENLGTGGLYGSCCGGM